MVMWTGFWGVVDNLKNNIRGILCIWWRLMANNFYCMATSYYKASSGRYLHVKGWFGVDVGPIVDWVSIQAVMKCWEEADIRKEFSKMKVTLDSHWLNEQISWCKRSSWSSSLLGYWKSKSNKNHNETMSLGQITNQSELTIWFDKQERDAFYPCPRHRTFSLSPWLFYHRVNHVRQNTAEPSFQGEIGF